MALTYGQMTDLILAQTFRDQSFAQGVFNCIVSAIKEIETNQFFVNTSFVQLQLQVGINYVELPNDFISVLELQLVSNVNDAPGQVVLTPASGFREMTFWELQTYQPMIEATNGNPYGWALWGNNIYVTPFPQTIFYLNMYYYKRDGYYPSNYSNTVDYETTSIWLQDFTQDATRYRARGMFYRDYLQSPELAASDFAYSDEAMSKLKIRNSQRETINVLGM